MKFSKAPTDRKLVIQRHVLISEKEHPTFSN